jgi:hypothetical protein
VVTQSLAPTLTQKKHLASYRFDPIKLEIGVGMGKGMLEWIESSMRAEHRRASGTLVGFDAQLTAVQQRNFANALITEVTLPKLDASSKESAYLTVIVAPESVEQVKLSGRRGSLSPRQKVFVSSNFKLEIDGLDPARVSKIDAFGIKQKIAVDNIGLMREPQAQPIASELADLTVTLSASSAD